MRTELEEKDLNECSRAGELMAWLYGEASPDELEDLQRHLRGCVQCRTEAESFGKIRQSLMAWRDESLGAEPVSSTLPSQVPQKQSAAAAIRQFLDLSPLWMKGAVGFAALVVCLLATLSVVRMRQTIPAISPAARRYSEQEVASLVEQRAQQRFAELQAAAKRTPTSATSSESGAPHKLDGRPNLAVQVAKRSNGSRRPLTKQEREELAADLRLTEPDGDDLDLIGDRLTRPPDE